MREVDLFVKNPIDFDLLYEQSRFKAPHHGGLNAPRLRQHAMRVTVFTADALRLPTMRPSFRMFAIQRPYMQS